MIKQVVDGILLVNKPQGITSNACLQTVKRLYQAKKAGHTGSLDPLATGMLPICFGKATKLSQRFLDADKAYRAQGKLGVKTSTADALGDIIESKTDFQVTEVQLKTAISQFQGLITQTPSQFSALKYQGKPLYYYARQGIVVPPKTRQVFIRALNYSNFDGVFFDIDVVCSKGTYIRNLVEDIGDLLGVGAHVTKLHRVYTGGFSQESMHTLDVLKEKTPEELAQCLLSFDYVSNVICTQVPSE